MALFASAGSLYQVNSTGGSTVWGVGTGGGGAADGVNIVMVGNTTSGGTTTGTSYSNSTGTVSLIAGSNITLQQSNNAIVVYGPDPSAASIAIKGAHSTGGTTSSVNTGVTFAFSNNVNLIYDGANVWGNAWVNASAGTTGTNVSRLSFADGGGVSFGVNTGTSFNATLTASVANYSIYFSDNSNATFSQSTAGSTTSVYIQSLAGGGGGGTGGVGISAGTQSVATGTVVFSNSNNVSFGMAGSTRITASIPAYSMVFDTAGASGNVTFSTSTNGSTTTVYASAAGGGGGGGAVGISMGAGTSLSGTTLGTRSLITSGTMGFFAGSNVYISQDSTKLVFIAPGQQIGAGSQTLSTTGPLNFANSNSITFGMSGSSQITASLYGNSLSFGTGGNITFGTTVATNATGATTTITGSSPDQYNIVSVATGAVFGGSQSTSTFSTGVGAIGFAAGSNITLRQTSNSIVIYGGAGAGGLGTVGVSAKGGSSAFTTLSFAESNGVGWTNVAGKIAVDTIGFSAYANSNTTQSSSGTLAHSLLQFAGAGGVSVGISNGSVVISGGAGGGGVTPALSGSNGSFSFSTATFGNLNGLSFYTSNGSFVGSYTVPTQTNQSLGVYGSSQTTGQSSSSTYDARSLSVVGAGAVSVGWSNSSLIVSAPNTIAQTVQSVGLYALGNTTQNSSTTLDARTLSFNALGAATMGYSNGSIQVSVPVQTAQTQSNVQGIIVSNTTYRTGDVSFSNLNGISFGSNGANVVTASYTVPTQTNQTGNIYGSSQTTGASSSSSYDHRSLTIVGAGANSVGWTNGSLIISAPNTVAQTNQSLGIYGSSQTTGASSSSTYDARSLTIVGQGANSVGWTNGSLIISAPNTIAQSNQTGNIYGSSQTTGASSSSSYDHRSLTIVGAGANSIGWTNGSLIISAPNTIAQTNQSMGIYATGANTIGNSSSSTHDARTLIVSGQGILSVGWSNGTLQLSVPSGGGAGDGYNIVQMLTSTTGGKTSGASTTFLSATMGMMAGSGIGLSQTSNSIVVQAVPNSLIFQNSNNFTWGTATASDATGYSTSVTASAPVNFSAGTTSNNLTQVSFANSNNMSFGLATGTITGSFLGLSAGMSTMGNTAGTTGLVGGAVYFVGSGEIALSQSVNGTNATVTIYEPTIYKRIYEVELCGATTTNAPTIGTFLVQPVYLAGDYSFAHGKMMRVVTSQPTSSQSYSWSYSGGNQGSSGTGQFGSTQTIIFFSRESTGTAANSSNLISFHSTTNTLSMGMSASVSWSNNVSSATMSLSTSNAFGFAWSQIGTNGVMTSGSTSSSGSTTASSTSTNANTQSSSYGNSFASAYFSSVRAWPFPIGKAFPQGEYWIGIQESTSSASTNYSLQRPLMIGAVQYLGFTTNTVGYVELGTQIATTNNNNIFQGWGSGAISGATSTTFPISSISNMSNIRTYFAFYGYSK